MHFVFDDSGRFWSRAAFSWSNWEQYLLELIIWLKSNSYSEYLEDQCHKKISPYSVACVFLLCYMSSFQVPWSILIIIMIRHLFLFYFGYSYSLFSHLLPSLPKCTSFLLMFLKPAALTANLSQEREAWTGDWVTGLQEEPETSALTLFPQFHFSQLLV